MLQQDEADGADMSVDFDGTLAIVEMRRPPNNFFDVDLVANLAGSLESLAKSGCRAAVLCSEGKHFCAGADFRDPRRAPRGDNGPHLYDMALRLFKQPIPLVAAVQGAAIGGGLGLALAADFRVASPDARFSANFARLGIHHGFGLTETLPRVVGHQRAAELLLTGQRLDGREAHAIGLCDRLVAPGNLRDEATAFAQELAASAPLAVRSIRETIRAPLIRELRAALDRERAEQEGLMRTTDFAEGIAAAAERRPPRFAGR